MEHVSTHTIGQELAPDLTFRSCQANRVWSTELGGPDPNVVSVHLRGQPRRVFEDCPACGVIVPRMHQQPLKSFAQHWTIGLSCRSPWPPGFPKPRRPEVER